MYTCTTHDTGDGMQPATYCAQTLQGIKDIAMQHLQYGNTCAECSQYCEDCECGEGRFQGDPDVVDSMEAVSQWDGKSSLTVYYFDGNPGKMTLSVTLVTDKVGA